jgi:hypothetical protein
MEEWSIIVNNKKLNLLQQFAGEIYHGPEHFHLKSEPEIKELYKQIYGDWFYITENGIFLQEWNSTSLPNSSLIFINFTTLEYKKIEDNIKSVFWDMKEDNNYFYLNISIYNKNNIELKINKEQIKTVDNS